MFENNIMKHIFRKMNNKGFSLTELLFVIILVGFIGLITAGGISTATRAHGKIVDATNAQVLLSTTTTVLRDELGMAKSITKNNDSNEIESFVSGNTGGKTSIKNSSDGIKLIRENESAGTLLVTEKAATSLISSFDKMTYDEGEGTVTITNLKITRKTDNNQLANLSSYVIKVVDPAS